MLETVLIVLLILVLGALPNLPPPYWRWGHLPCEALGLILMVVITLLVFGRV
jgi:hypothetical protein